MVETDAQLLMRPDEPTQLHVPRFREFAHVEAWGGSISIQGITPEELIPHLQTYADARRLPLFGYIIPGTDATSFTYHMTRYPRTLKYEIGKVEEFGLALRSLARQLSRAGVQAIAQEDAHAQTPHFRIVLGLSEGYGETALLRTVEEVRQRLPSALSVTPAEIVTILPHKISPYFRERAAVIEGGVDHLSQVFHLADEFKQERFAVELIDQGAAYVVETRHCTDPDDGRENYYHQPDRIVVPALEVEVGDGTRIHWRRNYLARSAHVVAEQRGIQVEHELRKRLDSHQGFNILDHQMTIQLEAVTKKGHSETLSDFLSRHLDTVLATHSSIRSSIITASSTILEWLDGWVYPYKEGDLPGIARDQQFLINRLQNQYDQVASMAGPDQFDMANPWQDLKFLRFLYAKGSAVHECISREFGFPVHTLLADWMRLLSQSELLQPEVFQEAKLLAQGPDIDWGIFPAPAFYMAFAEMQNNSFLPEFLKDFSPRTLTNLVGDEESKFELQLPVADTDILLPYGCRLNSPNVLCRIRRGKVEARPEVEYASIDFFVNIQHETSGQVQSFQLLSMDFIPDPSDESTLDFDSRTGWKASVHGLVAAFLVNGRKYRSPVSLSTQQLQASKTRLTLAIEPLDAVLLVVPNSMSPYMVDRLAKGKVWPIDHNFIAQEYGRYVRDNLFNWPLVPQTIHEMGYFPGYHSAASVFKNLALNFDPRQTRPETLKELERNIRQAWLLDTPQTLRFLVDSGFIKFFRHLSQLGGEKILYSARNAEEAANFHNFYTRAWKAIRALRKTENKSRRISEFLLPVWKSDLDHIRKDLPPELGQLSDFELVLKLTEIE